ncbi:hypothetical protein [Amycolatopsis sp. NPDC051903]|uniref:hypothetical protein n=1 Tax=Amycolatopsis sp. NPDC051903 TaxID=3363936 RepID=UPI00379EFA29
MSHLRPAVLAAAVLVAAATTACDPAATSTRHSSTTHDEGGSDSCDSGWVCGTCPDGSTWGYLDEPQYTNDPTLSRLFFDNKNPCG